MTKSVLRRNGEPRLLLGLLSDTLSPESSLMGSVPAKPTMDFWWGKRRISPISAINWGPMDLPTPVMAMTVSYSGSWEASRSISVR